MLEILLSLTVAFAKIFTVATALNLPLENIRNLIFSSESILILFLFLFVAGETRSIWPALFVTMLYLYMEVVPKKLMIADNFFEDDTNSFG